MWRALNQVYLLALLAAAGGPAGAQVGVLDPDFGDGGLATAGFGRTSYHWGNSMALLPDGRFVVAGAAFSASAGSVTVTRLHADGAVDSSFGDDGTVLVHFDNGADATATDVVARPDGRLLVAAYDGGVARTLLAFTADGAVDGSFGQAGRVTTPIDVAALALEPDGDVVAAGGQASGGHLAVARFRPTGALDSTFGDEGVAAVPLPAGSSRAYSVSVDAADRIVAVGMAIGPPGGIAVVRLLPNGAIDSSFGTSGYTIAPAGNAYGRDIEFLDDQRIVVAAAGNNGSEAAVLRLLADGQPDPGFGVDGVVDFDIPANGERLWALVPQLDGGMIAAGTAWTTTVPGTFLLARFSPDGSLDPTFGDGGIVLEPVGAASAAYDLAQLPDGRLVAAGRISDGVGAGRYTADGRLDQTFGVGGVVSLHGIGPGFDRATRLAARPDGRFLVGAAVEGYPCYLCAAVVQFLPDGRIDSTFGANGRAVMTGPLGVAEFGPVPVALLPDGKLAALSYAWPATFGVSRFTSAGVPDVTFGQNGTSSVTLQGGELVLADLLAQSDGRLVVVGRLDGEPAAVRILPDGTVDPAWGTDSVAVVPRTVWKMIGAALMDDGRIVLAGVQRNPTRLVLAALLPDGTLDPGFGTGGIAVGEFASAWFEAFERQPDGRLVAVGIRSSTYFAVRYTADGSIDSTFSGDGIASIAHAPGRALAATVQPDGRILLAGTRGTSGDFGVLRLLSDGAPDPAFGVNGWTYTSFANTTNGVAAIGVLPSGRIVAAGSVVDPFQSDLALAGYLPESTVDAESPVPDDAQDFLVSTVRPNPFTGRAGFSMQVARAQHVDVALFDLLGRRVATLHSGWLPAGAARELEIDGAAMKAGTYVVRVTGESFRATRRVTRVR